jgi:UDP-N-acetylmuramoyl-tripeptide--D-alanyl-D-alanine ligase
VRIDGKRIILIDDAYNANPASMRAAIQLLGERTPSSGGRRVAVLGDMLELGPEAPTLHAELAELLVNMRIGRVYVVGELMANLWDHLPRNLRASKVATAEELIPTLRNEFREGDIVLFKGSNALNLSSVVKSLRKIEEAPVAFLEGFGQRLKRYARAAFLGSTRSGSVPQKLPRRNWQVETDTYTLTFCGDTSLGDYYLSRGEENRSALRRLNKDPLSFFDDVRPLIENSNDVIINLETCLITGMRSFLRKKYLGWDNPARTTRSLKQNGVTAANLANNHTMDFGSDVLLKSIKHLQRSDISVFGAGRDLLTASRPLIRDITVGGVPQTVYILGAFSVSQKYRNEYNYYADTSAAGVNPLSPQRIMKQVKRLRRANPAALIIVCPHWHRNYVWASEAQLKLSSKILSVGADLIIGHGAHMLQQCHWSESGTLLMSLGNFIFNSPGRYAKFSAPPFSLIARIEISLLGAARSATLKLYPIVTDNIRTDFNVQPIDRATLASIYKLLDEKAPAGSSFRDCFETGDDKWGLHIKLNKAISPRFAGPA